MHRPLWQILLAIFLVGFAVRRAAVGFVLSEGDLEPSLFVAYGLQAAVAIAAAIGLWLGRPWTIAAVLVLGVTVVAAALLEVWLGVRPAITAVGEVLIVGLSTGALALVLRHEFRGERGSFDRADPVRAGTRSAERR